MGDRLETLEQLLKGVSRSLFEIARDVMHERGIPAPGMAVLGHVVANPGLTVSELARRAHLAKSHVSKTSDSLCELGLLEKRPDPSDQRLVRMYATEKARAQLHELRSAVRARLSAAAAELPEEVLAALVDGLQLFRSALAKQKRTLASDGGCWRESPH